MFISPARIPFLKVLFIVYTALAVNVSLIHIVMESVLARLAPIPSYCYSVVAAIICSATNHYVKV